VTKVLYIEHDDDNRYMLKMRLERAADFEVILSDNTENGYKLAATATRARTFERVVLETSSVEDESWRGRLHRGSRLLPLGIRAHRTCTIRSTNCRERS